MGSTRKTPTVNLPQFDEEDKPSWLGDMNSAMALIDAKFVELNNKIAAQDIQILELQTQINGGA